MEKYLKVFKRPIVLAVALNLVPLLVFLVVGSCRFDSLDDYFMSSVLMGAYGEEYDVHLYFINILYGYFLKPFYVLFPSVGWYFIFEIFAAYLSFSAITYWLLKKTGIKFGMTISTLVLACFSPDFYFGMNFTQCAELLTAAGVLSVVLGSFEKVKSWMILGTLLLVWGYVMRESAFLLGMPFAVIILVGYIVKTRELPKTLFIVCACCCVVLLGVNKLNHDAYMEGEYRHFAAFQGPRAALGDVRYYDYDAAFSDLEERGFSGNDLRAGRHWMIYDSNVFSLASVQPLLKSIQDNRYELNVKRTVVSIVMAFSKSLWSTNAWCWFLLGLLLMMQSRNWIRVIPWVSLGLLVMCYGYLLYVNRVVHHVESGVWFYGMVVMLPFLEKNSFDGLFIARRIYFAIILFISVMYVLAVYSTSDVQERLNRECSIERSHQLHEFLDYAEQRKEKVFLVPFELYKSIASLRNENAFKSIQPGSWQNIFPLGYWNVYLPGMIRELEKRGVTNPLKDIVADNVLYVQEQGMMMFGPQSVWEEHYKKNLVADTIQRFGKIELLKYSIAEGDGE